MIIEMWQLKTTSVSGIVGTLVVMKSGRNKQDRKIPGIPRQYEIQRIAFSRTVHNLR